MEKSLALLIIRNEDRELLKGVVYGPAPMLVALDAALKSVNHMELYIGTIEESHPLSDLQSRISAI